MLSRPLLALYTTLCLLVSLISAPRGPELVCTLTGEPMQAVLATRQHAQPHRPCCDVSVSATADGTTRYTLTHRGCCDLRQSIERTDAPAVRSASAEFPLAILVALPETAAPPVVTDMPRQILTPRESAPRPPPLLSSASPRGPPSFS